MKITISADKKIVKKTTTSSKKLKSKSTVSVASVTQETSVLSVGDYGVFMVKLSDSDTAEPVEGRVIEICREMIDNTPILIFKVDVSTQFRSKTIDLISSYIVNWTKSGEDTISMKDLLSYSYEEDRNLQLDNGTVTRVNDIVSVTNSRTNETVTGRIATILQDQVTIDCSTPGYSKIYIINSMDIDNGNIEISGAVV